MVVYKSESDIHYIQCDECGALCNKFNGIGGFKLYFPKSHPEFDFLTAQDKESGKDFCSHSCVIEFVEKCQRESFKLNIRKMIDEDKNK